MIINKKRRLKKMKTKKYIEKLRENFVRITSIQEKAIIKYWGQNIGNEFTEQDVWEQTRKVINDNQKNILQFS